MAQITINIPDAQLTRILDGFAYEYRWTSDLGVTKAAFAKQQIVKYAKRTVKNAELAQSDNAARATINSEIEAINIT